MQSKTFLRFLFILICAIFQGESILSAQENLRLMFYNIYRYPYHSPEKREQILADINKEVKPDILMVCELVDAFGAEKILNNSFVHLEDSYKSAAFEFSVDASYDPLHQMVYYNERKLHLLKQKAYPTGIRDINHYTFYLKTESLETRDTAFLEVFICHLKSSQGSENKWLRKRMVDTFFMALESIPEDRAIVFSGDFNFYDAHSEPAYNKIVSPNNSIKMVDPLGWEFYDEWHNNEEYASIHTQATRISTEGFGLGGAGGGLDDRFDFIFLSENLLSNPYMYFEEGSYEAIGNNGNCFKNRIDALECVGKYDQNLRSNLYYMSDHLPVALNLKINDAWLETVGFRVDDKDFAILPYGNRIKETLHINFLENGKQQELYIFNTLGQRVIHKSTSYQKEIILDVNHLKEGLYFLKVHQDGKSYHRRLLK